MSEYDEMILRVEYLIENKVPFSEWTEQELIYYNYEFAGLYCCYGK